MRIKRMRESQYHLYAYDNWRGYAIVVKKWRWPYRYFNLFTTALFYRWLQIGFDICILDEFYFNKYHRDVLLMGDK